MKVRIKRIYAPKLPRTEEVRALCEKLTDSEDCRDMLCCCICLSLAVAPDDERDMFSAAFYAAHFADGFTQDTLEAVRLWNDGRLTRDCDTVPEAISKNFVGSYLFKWQRPYIVRALECYGRVRENGDIKKLCGECYSLLCGYALKNIPLADIGDT